MTKTPVHVYFRSFAVICAVLMLFSAMNAQTRRSTRSTTTTKKPPVTTPAPSADVKDAKTKVSNQIKNVSKFMYILGISSAGLEQSEKDARAGRLSRVLQDEHTQNKQKINLSIRNLKAGLAELEIAFRTKPALRTYLPLIDGITESATQAEELAGANRFSEAGRPFLVIIEKLTDALAALPN